MDTPGNGMNIALLGIGAVGLYFAWKQSQAKTSALVTTTPNGNVSVRFDYGSSDQKNTSSSVLNLKNDSSIPVGAAPAVVDPVAGLSKIPGVGGVIGSVAGALFGVGGIFGKSAPKAPVATDKSTTNASDSTFGQTKTGFNKSEYYGPVAGLADFLEFLSKANSGITAPVTR